MHLTIARAGLVVIAVTAAAALSLRHVPAAEPVWQPITDAKQVLTIRGIPYVPEFAGRSWSIARAVNASSDLIRFEVRQGDQWEEDTASGENKERSEFDGYKKRWDDGTEVWGAYSFNIEPGPAYRSDWTAIGQMHGSKTRSFHVHFKNETMTIYSEYRPDRGAAVATPRYSGTLARDVWHHVVFRLRQNAAGNGKLDFWLDGNKLVDFTGPVGASGNQAYWKYGIYRGYGPIAAPFAIKYANMEVGTTDLSARITQPLAVATP
jgi:hypothetical protein